MYRTAVRCSSSKGSLKEIAGKVADVVKQSIVVNPDHSSPYLEVDEYREVADIHTDEKYLVGANFPLKQEPLAKKTFHYYERAARVNQRHTFNVDATQKDTAAGEGAYYARNSQVVKEVYGRLGIDANHAANDLPPVPPKQYDSDSLMVEMVRQNNQYASN